MDFHKMMCLCMGTATVVFSTARVQSASLEIRDRDGILIPLPPARDDGEAGEKSEGFKLSLKSDARKYAINEQINLSVKFTNIDRDNVAVEGLGPLEFKLEILRPDGTLAPLTPEGEKSRRLANTFSGGPQGPESPGAMARGGLTGANLDFDMTQLGAYYLRVLKAVPSRTDPSKKVTIVSNVVTMRIEAPKAKDAATGDDAAATDDAPQDNEVAVTEVAPD